MENSTLTNVEEYTFFESKAAWTKYVHGRLPELWTAHSSHAADKQELNAN